MRKECPRIQIINKLSFRLTKQKNNRRYIKIFLE